MYLYKNFPLEIQSDSQGESHVGADPCHNAVFCFLIE